MFWLLHRLGRNGIPVYILGIYDTKQEAEAAAERAIRAIPTDQVALSEIVSIFHGTLVINKTEV